MSMVSVTDFFSDERTWAERAERERLVARGYQILAQQRQRSASAGMRASPAGRARATTSAARVDRVVLKAGARSEIVNELCDWDRGEWDESRETGGYLIGWLDGTTLVVTRAFGPGPGAIRGYGRLSLDSGYAQSVMGACLTDEGIVGDWHSHPERAGASKADMHGWASEANRFSGQQPALRSLGAFHIGLIATRASRNWGYPAFACYLSRGDATRAQPIALDEEREVEERGRNRLMLVRSTASETDRERWRL
jgi:integrative and conjugative element protein (TIGR02256 family)